MQTGILFQKESKSSSGSAKAPSYVPSSLLWGVQADLTLQQASCPLISKPVCFKAKVKHISHYFALNYFTLLIP